MKSWFQSFSEKAELFIQKKKSLFSSSQKKEESPVTKSTKTTWLWVATVFCAMSALVAIPSFSTLLWLVLSALILPINKWQELIKKNLPQNIKPFLIGALLILSIATFPSTEPPSTSDESSMPLVVESSVDEIVDTPTPEEEPIVEEHIHEFSEATCTAPKTCSCGATEGEVAEHSWSSATCTAPKTCSVCGETSGSHLSHNYSNGYCTRCGTSDPNYTYEETVWVSGSGKRYHCRASCSGMKNPQEVSLSTAEARGLTPCGRCY